MPDNHLYHLLALINERLDLQMEAIIRKPEFLQLKASWEGLFYLVLCQQGEQPPLIKLLDYSWAELITDVTMLNLARSHLYQLIYQKELNTLGGHPFGAINIDYPLLIPDQPLAIKLVVRLSQLGQQTLCPFVFSLSHRWLNPDTEILPFSRYRLQRLSQDKSMKEFFDMTQSKPSRFAAMVWPGFYLGSRKSEGSSAPPIINGGYALMGCICREYSLCGWFVGMSAWGENTAGGAILPEHSDVIPHAAVSINEDLEDAYADMGIMPLSTTWLEKKPGLFTQRMLYREPQSSSSQESSLSIICCLISCRIGHYLKAMLRSLIGTTLTKTECEVKIHHWIQKWCTTTTVTTEEYLARFPLRKASVKVSPIDQSSTIYNIQLDITPCLAPGTVTENLTVHLQYEQDKNSDQPVS